MPIFLTIASATSFRNALRLSTGHIGTDCHDVTSECSCCHPTPHIYDAAGVEVAEDHHQIAF